jgi:EPS-associated MarR family transcriptional regulator
MDEEIRYKILSILKDDPSLTQREMMRQTGVSLGKVNYCVSALVEKGQIRVERFKNDFNKTAYLYHITPTGIKAFTNLSLRFLKIKLKEYDRIKAQIESLYQQVHNMDAQLCEDPELLSQLRNIF